MSLLVRERPPLNLSVCVAPPGGGPSYRWGVDSKNVAYVPDDLTFATSMPGGFSTFSCTLQRNRHLPWPDEQEFSNVTVLGLGGRTVAWQGRLEQLPDVQGYQAQVNPQASGWQAHLDDDDSASVVFIDQQLSGWGSPSTTRQIALVTANNQLGSSAAAADPTSGNPALVQTISDSWASPIVPKCEAWYDSGAGNLIATIYYNVKDPGAGIGFQDFLSLSQNADASGSVEASLNLANTSGVSGYFTPTTPWRFAVAQHQFDSTAGGGGAGSTFNVYWYNLAVYGNHGLTGRGSDPVGFLASDMIGYTLGRWCPKITYTTGSSGTIRPSSFVIPQAAFKTPTTSSTIVKQLAQYELLDWAVWELGSGPTAQPAFYLNQFGARGRSWRARVGPTQLQDNGPNVSRIWNGVIVQFTAVDGTTQTVGPPGSGAATTSSQLLDSDPLNPANEAGLRRWGIVQMGTSTPAGATQVGATFLQAQKQLDSSGQASLVGHVQDSSGVTWPSWMVRAGDSIVFVDSSAPTTSRRIVSTSYTHANRTNTITLDQPPAAMDALLQRLSLVIQPIGFS